MTRISDIKKQLPIEEVLESHGAELPFRTGWNNWTSIKCPYHDDRSASASYTTGYFVCHAGCVEGDVIDLVAYQEGFDDVRQAMDYIQKHFLDEGLQDGDQSANL